MSFHVLFCQCCNLKFVRDQADDICPVCSQQLAIAHAADTAEAMLASSRFDADVVVDEEEDADHALVGCSLGSYRIDSFVGKGGMARVYRATHDVLERQCAIKVLDPQLVERDPEYVNLFLTEARSVAALVHPNVVTVHNVGRQGRLHFIEMEYVVGETLQSLVFTEGRLGPLQATELMVQVAAGLAAAHEIGVIHRDVKPANVLVGDGRLAKLADFGLAKRVVAQESSSFARGAMVGTPCYMAPELFFRRPATRASDVYAAGVTYYYLMTGSLPFVDTELKSLAKKHRDEPVPDGRKAQPDIPDEALQVVKRCLAKRIEDRYPDGRALRESLRALFGNLRDLSSLVHEASEGTGFEWQGRASRFETTVPLGNGRKQRVVVETNRSRALADHVVKIYSVCAPLDESYALRALELNAEIPHGSIAVQEIFGVPHFVMIDTYPRATCDVEEVRRSVLAIARWADYVERTLTGQDHN